MLLRLLAGYGGAEAVAKGLNLALVLGLAALVDVHDYGVISLFLALELVLVELLVAGQHSALLRHYELHRDALPRLYSACIAIVLIASILAMLFWAYVPIAGIHIFSTQLSRGDIFLLTAGVAFQCQLSLYLAYLRSTERVLEYGLVRIGFQSSKLAAVAIASLLVEGASAYPLGVCLASAAVFLALLPRIERHTLAYTQLLRLSGTFLKENARLGLPLSAHAIFVVLHSIADRFFLEQMLSTEALAIYSFASVQGTSLFFVINVLSLAYVPRIYRGKVYCDESRKILATFLRVTLVCVFASALVVYFALYPATLMFVPPQYRDGQSVLLLAIGTALVYPLGTYGLYKLTLLRKVGCVPVITLGALCVNLLLNRYLIPLYGIEGAALASVTSHTLFGLLMISAAHLYAAADQRARQ
jgi:O-antigen/teichoic acid export membrane protein